MLCRCANIRSVSTIHCIEMFGRARVRNWRVPQVLPCSCWRVMAATLSCGLRSGEIRKVHVDCKATLGEVGNSEHSLRSIGKAGAMRWRGVRPTVRGVVMKPG